MRIESARFEGGELILKTGSPDARTLVRDFKAGEYELRHRPKKRSLDANAYAWVLIHAIAHAAGTPPIEVYRDAVMNVGGTSDILMMPEKAVETFTKAFVGDHLGRQVETMPSRDEGWVTVIAHYGSSDFSGSQMSILIDNLIQDANALGITTWEQDRIDSLLEEWDAKQNKGSANPEAD